MSILNIPKFLHVQLLAVLAGSVPLFSAETSHAYDYANWCWQPYKLDTGSLPETLVACSFPSGSNQRRAVLNSITDWNAVFVGGVTNAYVNNSCKYEFGDWYNSIAMVPPAELGSANAWTYYRHSDECFHPWQNPGYSETDVLIRNDLNWEVPDEIFPVRRTTGLLPAYVQGYGRSVVVHEMGHQLGLAHVPGGFSMEAESSYFPLVGGSKSKPMPDDIAGISNLYGSKNYSNVMVSNSKLVNNKIEPTSNPSGIIRAGQTVTLEFTLINQDLVNAKTISDRIILQDMTATYWELMQWSGYVLAPGAVETWSATWTYQGGLPSGDYDFRYEVNGVSPPDATLGDNNIRLYRVYLI